MAISKKTIVVILVFFIFQTPFMPHASQAQDQQTKETALGSITLKGQSPKETKASLDNKIQVWLNGKDIKLTSEFEEISIPRSVFQFNRDKAKKRIEQKTKRTIKTFFMRPKNVNIPIEVTIDKESDVIKSIQKKEHIDQEKTFLNLKKIASQLEAREATIVYKDGVDIELETVAKREINIPDISDAVLNHALDALDEYVISAQAPFSYLKTVDYPEKITGSTKEMSFVPSVLYSLFLQTDFDIVMRHAQLKEPSYIDAGLDVEINQKQAKDLIVSNPNDVSYKLDIEKEAGVLSIALKSSPQEQNYTYAFENIEAVNQKTIHRYSEDLQYGEQVVIDEGSKGKKVDVYRHVFSDTDELIEKQLISKDVYLPKPRIMLLSTSEEPPEEEEDELEEELYELEEELNTLEDELYEMEEKANEEMQAELQEKMNQVDISMAFIQEEMQNKVDQLRAETFTRFDELDKQLEYLLERLLELDTAESKEAAE